MRSSLFNLTPSRQRWNQSECLHTKRSWGRFLDGGDCGLCLPLSSHFTLSDLLTKSMKFYVQKNNAIFILKEEDKVEGGEERREGKAR